jgi:hypothetical protein
MIIFMLSVAGGRKDESPAMLVGTSVTKGFLNFPALLLVTHRGNGRRACSDMRGVEPIYRKTDCLRFAFGPARFCSVRQRFAIAALVIAWLCANGAVWDVLQVTAWGKMFAGYSGTMTITDALQATFDPAKPCKMCEGIAKAKGETNENVPNSDQQAGKFVLAIHVVDAPVFGNDPGAWVGGRLSSVLQRTDPVPLPPPRV